MKKHLKFILAGIILFAPFSILIYLEKSASTIAVGFGISMVLVALMYADIIKSFNIGINGTRLELREAIDEVHATIKMLENAEKPLLTLSLEQMYSEGMMFTSSMKVQIETFTGIKEFVEHAKTYNQSEFKEKLKKTLFGINKAAKSDLTNIYKEYSNEINSDRNELWDEYIKGHQRIQACFTTKKKEDYFVTSVDYSQLRNIGTDLPYKYRRKCDDIILELEEFSKENNIE